MRQPSLTPDKTLRLIEQGERHDLPSPFSVNDLERWMNGRQPAIRTPSIKTLRCHLATLARKKKLFRHSSATGLGVGQGRSRSTYSTHSPDALKKRKPAVKQLPAKWREIVENQIPMNASLTEVSMIFTVRRSVARPAWEYLQMFRTQEYLDSLDTRVRQARAAARAEALANIDRDLLDLLVLQLTQVAEGRPRLSVIKLQRAARERGFEVGYNSVRTHLDFLIESGDVTSSQTNKATFKATQQLLAKCHSNNPQAS